jgi:hypothetical protein
MTTNIASRLARATLVVALAAIPLRAAAQTAAAVDSSVDVTALHCEIEAPAPNSVVARVGESLADADVDHARAGLVALHDSLATEVGARPDDVGSRYLLALVIGARTEVEGGRTKIRLAADLHEQLVRVLELERSHAGAQHLFGRLHAGVMRLGRVTRFLAVNLLGASALGAASWDEAQRLLEAAATAEPCSPDHHYELARLYQDRGRDELARRELEVVLALRTDAVRGEQVALKANALMAHLEE